LPGSGSRGRRRGVVALSARLPRAPQGSVVSRASTVMAAIRRTARVLRQTAAMAPEHAVLLVRHGETEWSASGRHTSFTDVALTQHGREQAAALRAELSTWKFALVLSSPRRRAIETCELAGLGDQAVVDDDLAEWDYGDYEGRTTAQIRADAPGWTIFTG